MKSHIREERASRTDLGRIGDERELTPEDGGTAWCGAELGHYFFFVSADHALLALRYETGLTPCRKCLLAIQRVVQEEIGT